MAETPMPLRTADLLEQARAQLALESLSAATPEPSPHTARWLCLVPVWTPTLAARCGLPGWSPDSELRLVDTWRDEGLVEHSQTPLTIDELGRYVPAQHLFWMPRDTRAAWLTRVLAEDGRERLAALARDLAQVLSGQPRDQHMPPATWRWAQLAAALSATPSRVQEVFDHELDQALAHERQDEAWLWIEALQRVADVMPGEATILHQRAVRRLALFDRQRNDRAFLRDYLPRADQFDAWRSLLTGPDEVWGLHLLGGGGVGKTMLMRALTSGTPAHFPQGFEAPPTVTARIDFDHINPDYPAKRPGLLFAHLAEELRLKDESGRGADAFGHLFGKIAFLHEDVASDAASPAAVDDMLDMFVWACEAVSQPRGARVVLLLDTCEELARLGPDGRLPESVQRTFDLLVRLHERLPSVRVVLCGRRLLAGSYADGAVVAPDLPPRPWLRLHRMFPFSGDEAREYLRRAAVPEALVPPILARSTAAASSASLGLAEAVDVPRYSPFSLAVYATWVSRQGEAITADAILNDPVDHFVRIRILDRIQNPDVRRLLPHIALLGRFDEATLRACVDVRPEAADAVFREIAAQEWIAQQAGGYHAVEPELRTRLLKYFSEEDPKELQTARRRVLAVLQQLVDSVPAGDVPDEPISTALVRLQASDRSGLLAAWRTLDGRIVAGGHAAWGERVFGRLLADEMLPATVQGDAAAWGAFTTTYAECVLRQRGAAATADLWRRAWDWGQGIEDSEQRAALLVRVASGGLSQAAMAPDTEMAYDMWVLRLYNLLSDRRDAPTSAAQVAPVIAALMTCADAVELSPHLEPAPPMLERMAGVVSQVQRAPERALALVCTARFAARRQDAELAHRRFLDALQVIGEAHEHEHVHSLHWPATLEARSWVMLDALRGLVGLEPIEDTLARLENRRQVSSPIAANRLESLRLRLVAALRVPDASDETRIRQHAVVGPGDLDVPASAAHVALLPRAVTRAIDLVEIGRPAQGLRQLPELTSMAASARNTVIANRIERVRVEAVTRLRLGELGLVARHVAAATTMLPLIEREHMRAFLTDPASAVAPVEEGRTRADRHAIWRARRAFDDEARLTLARWGMRLLTATGLADGQGEYASASVALDLVECSDMGVEAELASHGISPASPEDWWHRHPALPEHALRLWIRSAALGVSPGGPTTVLVRRVGVRRAAAIAMEEGELLALRLPGQALRLLALALTWYEDAHDPMGVWQVTALLSLTRVRAGVPRESVDLGGLRAAHDALFAYQRHPQGPDGLLAWSELETTTVPLHAPPATAEWMPWLHRLIALQQWVSSGIRPEVLFSDASNLPIELRSWPTGGAPGTTIITRSHITAAPLPSAEPTIVAPPPSAGPAPAGAAPTGHAPAGVPPAQPDAQAQGQPPSAASSGLPVVVDSLPSRAARTAGLQLIGALIAVLVLAAAAVVAGVPAWAAAVAVLPAVVLAIVLWRRSGLSSAAPTIRTWTAVVTPSGTAAAATRLAALDVSVALTADAGEAVATIPLRIRRTDAFSGLDALRQPPGGTALSSALPHSPPLQRVWLDLTLATAWPCWEALLWSGIVDVDRLQPAVVRRLRTARVTPGGVPPTGPWTVATIAATSSDQRQALYAWEPAVRGDHVRLLSVSAEQVRHGTRQGGVRVVHVVARPVETTAGLFFEVTGGERLQVQESLESLESERGTLFDASQLVNAFPDAACVLLQPPRRAALDLTPASRETSAQLRIIAASLAEHGTPLVVVVPPLDGELGAEIVRLLGRRLAAARRGRPLDPHEFSGRAREVIFSLAQRMLPRDPSIELALQIAVYVSHT